MFFAVGKDLAAGALVLLQHFDGENVIDLNVVRREPVVEEVGREHHIVASVPELGVVLLVKLKHVALADEAEAVEDHPGAE